VTADRSYAKKRRKLNHRVTEKNTGMKQETKEAKKALGGIFAQKNLNNRTQRREKDKKTEIIEPFLNFFSVFSVTLWLEIFG
jgi:hypothetical protein